MSAHSPVLGLEGSSHFWELGWHYLPGRCPPTLLSWAWRDPPVSGAWLALAPCPFPLLKVPGLGVEVQKEESVMSAQGAKVGCCLCQNL